MFWTMSSAVAQSTYFATRACSAEKPFGAHLALEILDRVGDLLHQLGEGARTCGAQPPEQEQQRRRRPHHRAFVRRDELVAPERRRGRRRAFGRATRLAAR